MRKWIVAIAMAGIVGTAQGDEGNVANSTGSFSGAVTHEGRQEFRTYARLDGRARLEGDIDLGTHEDVQRKTLSLLANIAKGLDPEAFDDKKIVVQLQQLLEKFATSDRRIVPFSLGRQSNSLWPFRTIAYQLAPSIKDTDLLGQITAAVAHINGHTTLRFVPSTSLSAPVLVKVGVMTIEQNASKDRDCSWSPDSKVVSLSVSCKEGNIVHELGHAAGLVHEHKRQDVARYFTPDYSVITKDVAQYKPEPGCYVAPYNPCSIMHYGDSFAGKKWFKLTARGAALHAACSLDLAENCRGVGQRCSLTPGDAQGMDRMYADTPLLPDA